MHLGREVHRLVQEVKQARGERSGSLLKAFGENLLKQKRRFAVAQGADASAICQNPGNWLQVLEGLAEALGRDVRNGSKADVAIASIELRFRRWP